MYVCLDKGVDDNLDKGVDDKMEETNNSGKKFKMMRNAFSLSQAEMAKILDTSKVTISSWENGEPNTTATQMKILISLGLNPLFWYDYGEITLYSTSWQDAYERVVEYISKLNAEYIDKLNDEKPIEQE